MRIIFKKKHTEKESTLNEQSNNENPLLKNNNTGSQNFRKNNTAFEKWLKISDDFLSPYLEMLSWVNSFTLSFIRRDAPSAFFSSLPVESFLAVLDNLAPQKVIRNIHDFAGPFFYQGNNTGVLLTHGFCSTAQEMQQLGLTLNKKLGYTVFCVLLAGHGTSPADLAQTDMIDWYRSIYEGYMFLKQICKRVFLIGHSMGGTLSLLLAANEPIEGVVTLCTPIKVKYFMQNYLFLVSDLLKYFPRKKDEIKFMEKNNLMNYRVSALRGVEHLLDLLSVARDEIKKVTVPILTISAGKDQRIPLDNAERIQRLVGSSVKRNFLAKESPHTILFGPEKEQVYAVTFDFLTSL